MPRVRVHNLAISVDGYGAGPDQGVKNPLGIGGLALHEWIFATRTFRSMQGEEGGTSGIDDEFIARGFEGIGAWIIGRNMFGPVRGSWSDDNWRGWWGNDPPYHVPVFILTHHRRAPIAMEGGTVFHFVTGGIHDALARAVAAAGGKDVRVGGGVSTIRQYLQAKLVDQMHIAITGILLGAGEHLLGGMDLSALGYECTQFVAAGKTAHVVITKRG